MEERKPAMDLVRVPREEQVFEREEVLGRDAASVFPTESQAKPIDSDTVNAMLGSNLRFITESELERIKAERGGRVEDGAVAPDKPLVEVLREAKEAKEAAFQAVWKSMKTGKNRPLDEEELHFIDAVEAQQREKDRAAREEEEAALDAFQMAVREAAERRAKDGEDAGPRPQPAPEQATGGSRVEDRRPKRKPAVPLVRVKPAAKAGKAAGQASSRAELDPGEKRARASAQAEAEVEADGGLGGLLGEYGSDTED